MANWHIGTVSEGTLIPEELALAFCEELEKLADAPGDENLILDIRRKLDLGKDFTEDDVNELIEALDEYARDRCPYTYFGAHPDDGADFGWWPDIGLVEILVRDGEILKVNDLADVPDDYQGEICEVNDHGNMSVGFFSNGKVAWYWEIV